MVPPKYYEDEILKEKEKEKNGPLTSYNALSSSISQAFVTFICVSLKETTKSHASHSHAYQDQLHISVLRVRG